MRSHLQRAHRQQRGIQISDECLSLMTWDPLKIVQTELDDKSKERQFVLVYKAIKSCSHASVRVPARAEVL